MVHGVNVHFLGHIGRQKVHCARHGCCRLFRAVLSKHPEPGPCLWTASGAAAAVSGGRSGPRVPRRPFGRHPSQLSAHQRGCTGRRHTGDALKTIGGETLAGGRRSTARRRAHRPIHPWDVCLQPTRRSSNGARQQGTEKSRQALQAHWMAIEITRGLTPLCKHPDQQVETGVLRMLLPGPCWQHDAWLGVAGIASGCDRS